MELLVLLRFGTFPFEEIAICEVTSGQRWMEWSAFSLYVGKAVRNYSVCMGIRWQIPFSELNFSQFVDQNVKIIGRRLYSPRLKDVAVLEVIQKSLS